MAYRKDACKVYRIIGSFLIISGCTLVGAIKFSAEKREIRLIQELVNALNIMICQLEFQRTPLPELCTHVAKSNNELTDFFLLLENELKTQVLANVSDCVDIVIENIKTFPGCVEELLLLLGDSLGRYDADGQLSQLRHVVAVCCNTLDNLQQRHNKMGKTNQTLWICAGVALAVIML